MLWLWRWGSRRLIEAEAGATGAYLCRVCRLKEEERQLKCQHKNRKSRAIQNRIRPKEDPLLYFACSAPKMQRDFRGQIRVGWSGKSWERQAK
jgi:hypothetical protein